MDDHSFFLLIKIDDEVKVLPSASVAPFFVSSTCISNHWKQKMNDIGTVAVLDYSS